MTVYAIPRVILFILLAYYQGQQDIRRRGYVMAAIGVAVGFIAGVAL